MTKTVPFLDHWRALFPYETTCFKGTAGYSAAKMIFCSKLYNIYFKFRVTEGEMLFFWKKVTFYGILFFYHPIYMDNIILFITSTVKMSLSSPQIYHIGNRTCAYLKYECYFFHKSVYCKNNTNYMKSRVNTHKELALVR